MAENKKDIPVTEEVAAQEKPEKAPKAKAKKAKSKGKDAKKANIFVRIGRKLKNFWKEYTSELKKVAWMPWKDVRKNTLLVVCAVAIVAVAVAIVDTTFGEIIEGIAGLVG